MYVHTAAGFGFNHIADRIIPIGSTVLYSSRTDDGCGGGGVFYIGFAAGFIFIDWRKRNNRIVGN